MNQLAMLVTDCGHSCVPPLSQPEQHVPVAPNPAGGDGGIDNQGVGKPVADLQS
jgi:hypothetical protein